MNRAGRWVLAVLLAQGAVIGIYGLVEHHRDSKTVQVLGTQPPMPVDFAMPSLTLRGRDGAHVVLKAPSRRTIVHVWATWCPPCRAELGGLLDLPSKYGVPVVAIALDRSWQDVARFVGEGDGSHVRLGEASELESPLGVIRLPVTFVVEADARVSARFDGARDWTDESFVRRYVVP